VIAAAGSGQRLGAGGPKAFVPLAGRAMVEWSIAAFHAAPSVGAIVVACPPAHAHDLDGNGIVLVDGGATRAESVANALRGVESELVAIHDAARPFVTAELIEDVVEVLRGDPAAAGAIAAAPVTDTIKRVDAARAAAQAGFTLEQGLDVTLAVEETLNRQWLWAAQTPQVFRVGALRDAMAAHPAAIADATDEAMIVEAAGGRVLIHPTSAGNLKVTMSRDLVLAELLLAERAAGA
jgi:2-C-methyl-D-erythritol 4-phosphate cytidylyltransferase